LNKLPWVTPQEENDNSFPRVPYVPLQSAQYLIYKKQQSLENSQNKNPAANAAGFFIYI